MTKIKNPLFSFDARGSVGGVLTFSRVKGVTVAKRIPSHRDARTLPQLYQRWRFVDAKHYWRSLSEAQRVAYETEARPHHMTGWAYFLGLYLSESFDQVLWLPLDMAHSTTAQDISGQANHGTIYGCSPMPSIIDGGCHLDGTDDYVDCGNDDSLDITSQITCMGWIRMDPGADKNERIITKNFPLPDAEYVYSLLININMDPHFYIRDGGAYHSANWTTTSLYTRWYHLCGTYNGVLLSLYVDGILRDTTAHVGDIDSTVGPLLVGRDKPQFLRGDIDDVRIYNRSLSADHIYEIATTQSYSAPLL